MKQFAFLFLLFSLIIFTNSCTVVNSAKNKTNREISKKTNQKIEDIFNKDKNKNPDNKDTDGTVPPDNDSSPDPTASRNKSDFIPGEKIIFIDTLHRELMGEFPSKWDLKSGSVENMQFENSNVIGFISGATIFPLMDEKEYLPEIFTLEFDCYYHNYGNEAYYLDFNGKEADMRINIDGVNPASGIVRTNVANRKGWRHIAVSFNKRSLKIYYNNERLTNIPNVKERPTSVMIQALSPGRSKGNYAMIKNIRIAEGGVPLYERLVTDGKFVTNDIHFEYNSAEIKSDSWRTIIRIADMMEEHKNVKLRIEGHTDGDGSENYNLSLSEKRAAAVKSALIKEGISQDRLTTMGFGESQPIASNSSNEGKAQNRRVEFILLN